MTRGGPLLWRAFELGFRPWLRRQLHRIHLANLPPESQEERRRPLLLVANHMSWFDGFLLREVQRQLRPAAVLRTVMLEDQLRRNPVLHALGGMGLDPERPLTFRTLLRQLKTLSQASPHAGLVVSFFPQGRIYPSFRRPLGFSPGLGLLARTLAPCTVQEVGMHMEPGNRLRPETFILGGRRIEVDGGGSVPVEDVEAGISRALDQIHRYLAHFGENARQEWPQAPHLPLPDPDPGKGSVSLTGGEKAGEAEGGKASLRRTNDPQSPARVDEQGSLPDPERGSDTR